MTPSQISPACLLLKFKDIQIPTARKSRKCLQVKLLRRGCRAVSDWTDVRARERSVSFREMMNGRINLNFLKTHYSKFCFLVSLSVSFLLFRRELEKLECYNNEFPTRKQFLYFSFWKIWLHKSFKCCCAMLNKWNFSNCHFYHVLIGFVFRNFLRSRDENIVKYWKMSQLVEMSKRFNEYFFGKWAFCDWKPFQFYVRLKNEPQTHKHPRQLTIPLKSENWWLSILYGNGNFRNSVNWAVYQFESIHLIAL